MNRCVCVYSRFIGQRQNTRNAVDCRVGEAPRPKGDTDFQSSTKRERGRLFVSCVDIGRTSSRCAFEIFSKKTATTRSTMVLQVLDLVASSAGSEAFYGDCPTSYTNLDVNSTAQPTCTVIPPGILLQNYF